MTPLFDFTTGDPGNLTGGDDASMTDIQGPFVDLRAALNGQLDEQNVPNLTAAFESYDEFHFAGVNLGGIAAGTYMLAPSVPTNLAAGAAGTAQSIFAFNPADHQANSRTTRVRLRTTVVVNAVPPAVNFTVSLNAVGGIAGASGVVPTPTLGALVVNAVTTTPASGITGTTSSDASPTAGQFVLSVLVSGTMAAGSSVAVLAQVQTRRV